MPTSDWMNSPGMKRAALIGIASNPAQPMADRLAIALQVIGELETAFAAARREGWAQAIEALMDDERYMAWLQLKAGPTSEWAIIDALPPRARLAAYLTDRAAALTEEGTNVD